MDLMIKPKAECTYDAVALGEVMLRLDPGEGRIRNARSFRVFEGGGEYNVARGLRKCFGLKTAIITAFADNETGMLLEDLILQGGVDTSLIQWMEADAMGKNCRNGLNFTERGFGIRGALGCSDRGNTAISKMKPEDFNLDYIFGTLGVRWFHTGGIYAALSEESCNTAIAAIQTAKKYGTIVSYDLNYRKSLWEHNGGILKAQQKNKEIVSCVDVLIGNEEDFTACLGIDIRGNDHNLSSLSVEGYKVMMTQVIKQYPNLKMVAATLREVKSASFNNWQAICYSEDKFYCSRKYENLEIMDRVGGGDSFVSGFVYGLLKEKEVQESLEYGVAHGALAMTTPGDNSMATLREVEGVVQNIGARVQR